MANRKLGSFQTSVSGVFSSSGSGRTESKPLLVRQAEDLTIMEGSPEILKRENSVSTISTDSIKKVRQP